VSVADFLKSTQLAVENSDLQICRARQSDALVGSIWEKKGIDVAGKPGAEQYSWSGKQ